MTLIEFLNFYGLFIIALIVTRALQILFKDTWLSGALGALQS